MEILTEGLQTIKNKGDVYSDSGGRLGLNPIRHELGLNPIRLI